jgi:hypothetical protein
MQRAQRVGEGLGQIAVNLFMKVKADAESDDNREDGTNQPLAQFLEVLEERHLPAA